MSSTFANGTVRVTTPPSYDAAEPAATRGLPDPAQLNELAGHTELLAALQDSDLDLVQTVDLTPRRSRDLEPEALAPGTVQLDIDVSEGEDAVVLLERDGVYSWHLPVDTGRRTRSLEPGPQTRSFEIDVQPEPGSGRSGAHGPPRPRTPGQRRPGRCAGAGLPLRRARPDGEGRREDGGARQDGPGPPDRCRGVQLGALRDPRRAAPADRPAGAGAAVHPRHLLLDRRRLRCAERGGERPRIPAHRPLGVRRRHRVRPQDPQRRPQEERRGPAEAAADPPARGRARLRHRHAQPRRADHALVRRAGAAAEQLARERRQHRVRGLDPWRNAPRRPRALVGHGRHLHQPRRRLGEGADDGRSAGRGDDRGRGGQGHRGLREVPRLLHRDRRRGPRPRGDGARWSLHQGAPEGTAQPADGPARTGTS